VSPLCAPFARALASRRADYNAQFLMARRASPGLDESAFRAFLIEQADPLVAAVTAVDERSAADVVEAVYGVGLELVGQSLAGPAAGTAVINQAFVELFPALARLLARAPQLLLPRLCNALHQLATSSEARPQRWCALLVDAAPALDDVEELLRAGQVAAWLAGLAHYRAGALALCADLRAGVVARLLEIPEAGVSDALAALADDPWYVPSSPSPSPRLVGRIGAFRGLGGPFLHPPHVSRSEGGLLIHSGAEAWLVVADAFGRTLHRARPEELEAAQADALVPGVEVEPGRVRTWGAALALPDEGPVRSATANATTLLVAPAHSYQVIVVALPKGGR